MSLLLLGWFVTRTDVGLGMRAAAEDMAAAQLVGLDVNRLIIVAFAIASAFAGLAGVLWAAQSGVVEPNMGFTPLLKAFVAAIIGGFGSIAGALLGGYLLGALEVCIVAFLPSQVSPYRDAIVFALLIAFLLFRPDGLLHARRRSSCEGCPPRASASCCRASGARQLAARPAGQRLHGPHPDRDVHQRDAGRLVGLGNGLTGVFSLGHVGFVAVGAYVSGILSLPVTAKAAYLPHLPAWLAALEPALPAGHPRRRTHLRGCWRCWSARR